MSQPLTIAVRRLWPWALFLAAAAAAIRFTTARFTNDDYLFLLHGRQLAEFGGWPVRDILEEGRPLHFVVSALAQRMFGYRLLGEFIVDVSMLSLAYALTYVVAAELSQSRVAGAITTVMAILASPRLYDYPKAIIPVAAFWLCFQYLAQPTWSRRIRLGLFAGIAFLYRYDLGVYVGATCAFVIAAEEWSSRKTIAVTSFVPFAAGAAIVVMPFLLFIQVHRGIPAYLESITRFVRNETIRTGGEPPSFNLDLSRGIWQIDRPSNAQGLEVGVRWGDEVSDADRGGLERKYDLHAGKRSEGRTWQYVLRDTSSSNVKALLEDRAVEDTNQIDRSSATPLNPTLRERIAQLPRWSEIQWAPGIATRHNAVVWLYRLFRALPFVAVLVLAWRNVRNRPPSTGQETLKVLGVAAFCAMAAPLLLRGDLDRSSRLADMACASAVLGAWLTGVGIRSGWPARIVAVCVLIVTCASVSAVGSVGRTVRISKVFEGRHEFGQQIAVQKQSLLASPPLETWMSSETGVRGVMRYVRACTAPTARIFVTGFHPDVSFFSGRPIAGDRAFVLPGFWELPEEQVRTIELMRQKGAALAIIEENGTFARDLPLIQRYIEEHHRLVGTHAFGASTGVLYNIWADNALPPLRTYEPFALPCFH